MTRLPILKPKQVLTAHESWVAVVRVKGSHYQLQNPASGRRVTVPFHGRDVTRATSKPVGPVGRGVLEARLNSGVRYPGFRTRAQGLVSPGAWTSPTAGWR
jgi:predicted RNA binding protein YcfA (HicA-like mRNA interferase family)